MRRSLKEISIARRRWRENRRYFGCFFRDLKVGHFRKRDPFDCGNPQCGLCHRDKFPKRTVTFQEKAAALMLREGMVELER